MFSLKEYREPTIRLTDRLMYAALIAPGTVLQKGGLLQKTIAFRGPDLASSSKSELIGATSRLNNALRRLGEGWSIFVEAQRFQANQYPSSIWPCSAAWLVDFERRKTFEAAGAHYESAYYLTFAWQLPTQNNTRLQAIFFDDPASGNPHHHNARYLQGFLKTVAEIVSIMRGVFPEARELNDEETLTYLKSCVSTNRHPVKVPEVPMYLDALLPDMPFTPGDIPMLGNSFMPACTIIGFPGTSCPGLLDQLNHLQVEYRWTSRYICFDKGFAKKELEKYRKRWLQQVKGMLTMLKEEATKEASALVDNYAAQKSADADAALLELGEDLVSFGLLTTTVCVWDRDLEIARRKMAAVKEVIQSRGFSVIDETLNSQEAWLGSLPGNVYANVRRPIINSLNLAHIMPLSAVWSGDAENEHLKARTGVGTPHLLCSTVGDTPFRLSLNIGDVGHTAIWGPTGAGKTVLLGTLELAHLKYPNAQVIIFDKDRSARATTLAVGGTVYEPGAENSPVAFQPLGRIHERTERIWAAEFVSNLFEAQQVPQTPDVKARLDEALLLVAGEPPKRRTLTTLATFLGPELGAALRPYTIQGNYGQIFDADHDDLRSSFWTMFEMGHLMAMGEAAIVPALDYLFHRIEQRFDGRPTLLVLDEAWLFLRHPIFVRRLQGWLKTLRKSHVYVVFATQEIADAAQSPILATILSACATKIFLPDQEALTPAMSKAYRDLGLSETETAILCHAQKKRDYYYRSVKGRRLFQLGLGPVALAFASMVSPEDHKFLDRMVATAAPDEYAELILRHRGLDWAANLIREATEQVALAS